MARFLLTTFGCQMNVHDSERMRDVLVRARHEQVDRIADADFVVLNTCSVREKAEQKLLSEVGRLAKHKRERPEVLVVVAGCVAQQEGQKLLKKSSAIDLVIGPDNLAELPMLLEDLAAGGPPTVRTVFDLEAPRFLAAETGSDASAATAFVTTMKGCNERCSFCIVPYTRGPERYRPSDEIVAEVRDLCARGVREVTLLGQTVNSYRDPSERLTSPNPDDADETAFGRLLETIATEVPSLARLRYTSPHPRHLTASLVDVHARIATLAKHVHLPVQSGSDRVLKRMIRRYSRAEYVERTASLRARVPGLTLSTDVIVGFPGETDEDFEATLSLLEEVGFVGVFGFKYSPRPYTPALKLKGDVSEEEKSARLTRLFATSERLQQAHLARLVGTEQTVLIEGLAKRQTGLEAPIAGQPSSGGLAVCTGRTERNEIVHVANADAASLTGQLVKVTISRAFKHSLEGTLDESVTRALPARTRERERTRLPLVKEGAA